MAKFQIKLVCMNGGGSSPGEQTNYWLSDGEDKPETWIVHYSSEGRYAFLNELNDIDPDAITVLAKLTRQSPADCNILLESCLDNIYVEPAYPPKLAGLSNPDRIRLPESTESERHYFYLRPDDIIDLREDGVKIAVMFEIPNSTNSGQLSSDEIKVEDREEVQVKSSNADQDDAAGNDNETDSSDDDLDQLITDLPEHPSEVIPARAANPTIMETPHATTRTKDALNGPAEDNEPPYSTAHEGIHITSDTIILDRGDDSPTKQPQMSRVDEVNGFKQSTPPQEESTKPLSSFNVDMDGSPSAPRAESRAMQAVQDSEATYERSRTSADPAISSELDMRRVAKVSASGSLANSTKRKMSEVDDDEAMEEVTSSKKQKTRGPRVVKEQHEDDVSANILDGDDLSIERSDGESDSKDEESDEDIKPAKSGKMKSSRKSTTGKTSKPEPPESSPSVIVTAQRSSRKRTPATTASPPSSVASSTPTGPTPSILLSSDSPLRKGAALAFLKKCKAPIINDVKTRRAHFVCVLNGDKLTTTAKVLRSLAQGKLVVTEEWINKSRMAGRLLDPDDFVHPDLQPTIHLNRHTIFENTNLFFTCALAKAYGNGWKDIQELAKEAGANHVEEGSSGVFNVFKEGRMDVICFGMKDNDPDVKRLKYSGKTKVYHKNLLTESVRNGELDLDNKKHWL